ncbi:hypothetical protein LI82_00725 [Methanococcoides methylutens]|uniref:DUF2178 domain-containing protein n=2 Tax=Methanococcoides methylutens TaxID=2226 RepID=A0A099T6C1_METMT|nr:hypothetical protein LI82_00725 [Methanococcoides methylutens]
MPKKYRNRILAGTLILLVGIFVEIFMELDQIITITLVTMGSVIILYGILYALKYGEGPIQDEWSRKIGSISLSYSWITTFFVLTGMFWMNYFEIISLDVNSVIGVVFFVMIITANLFQLYFRRKGDVE